MGSQCPADLEFVGAPVRRTRGVEAVGEQFENSNVVRAVHGPVGELDRGCDVTGVDPAAGQRCSQTRAGGNVGGARQQVIQLRREPTRFSPEEVWMRSAACESSRIGA